MKPSKAKSFLFFLPYLICFLLFWLTPFVYGVILSTRKYSLTKGDGGFIGFSNYLKLFDESSIYGHLFLNGMKNTLLFVVISVIPLVIVGLALALLVQSLPRRAQKIYRTIFFISYAVSVTAVSAIFRWMFAGNGGYLNSVLMSLGILKESVPWLESQPYAWFSILAATLWWTVGFNMILFINALNEIDSFIFEAASLDGAVGLKRLWYITLPSIKNVFFFVLMNTIIASFNLYGQTNLMTRGGPGQSTQTVIMATAGVVFDKNNLGIGTAMALVTGIIMMLISLMQFFFTRDRED